MDRTPQIMAFVFAAAVSTEVTGRAAAPADASNIIFASKRLFDPHSPEPISNPVKPKVAPGISGETQTGAGGSASSHISSLIAAGLPKFDPSRKSAAPASAEKSRDGRAIQAAPGTRWLPPFVVRDVRIPSEDQVLTARAKAEIEMDKYLGPKDGLDRGILNRLTLRQLWQKIPVLGGLPFVATPVEMSNEDRAYDAGGANDTLPYPHPPPKVKDDGDQ